MNTQDYWIRRIEELQAEISRLEHKNKQYFDALAMVIAFQPEQKIELYKPLIVTFNPSRYMIEQTEDFLADSITLRLKELRRYDER